MIQLGKPFFKIWPYDFMGESFQCPDKQRTPEEGGMIQRPKRCVTTNNNKDEDNSLKDHTQNIAHLLKCFSIYDKFVLSFLT